MNNERPQNIVSSLPAAYQSINQSINQLSPAQPSHLLTSIHSTLSLSSLALFVMRPS